VWDFAETTARTAEWYKAVSAQPDEARSATLADLDAYIAAAEALGLPFAA
jgi:hypothetical protein